MARLRTHHNRARNKRLGYKQRFDRELAALERRFIAWMRDIDRND